MTPLLSAAILIALLCYGVAMALILLRLLIGPAAQDRVAALDALSMCSVPIVLVFAVRHDSTLYFEAALLIALSGFVSTMVCAKFLLRGEVIE